MKTVNNNKRNVFLFIFKILSFYLNDAPKSVSVHEFDLSVLAVIVNNSAPTSIVAVLFMFVNPNPSLRLLCVFHEVSHFSNSLHSLNISINPHENL